MEFLRKVGAFLKHFYDRIILALMLMLLAGVMITESCGMQGTKLEIQRIGGIAKPPTGEIPPLDLSQFNAQTEVAVSDLWQPNPKVVLADNYLIPTLSLFLRKYLKEYGEGSLYDPLVYVYSSHDPTSIVHYTTDINPATNQKESGLTTTTIDPENKTKTRPERTTKPFIENVHYYRSVQQALPVMLRKITVNDPNDKSSWLMQIDVWDKQNRKLSRFKKLGDSITVDGYAQPFKIVNVSYELIRGDQGIQKERSSIDLLNGNTGETITLGRNQTKPLGSVTYELVLMPPVEMEQNALKIETEKDRVFPISLPGNGNAMNTEYYMIVGEGDNALIAVMTDETGKPASGNEKYTLTRLDERVFKEWRDKLKAQMRQDSLPPPDAN